MIQVLLLGFRTSRKRHHIHVFLGWRQEKTPGKISERHEFVLEGHTTMCSCTRTEQHTKLKRASWTHTHQEQRVETKGTHVPATGLGTRTQNCQSNTESTLRKQAQITVLTSWKSAYTRYFYCMFKKSKCCRWIAIYFYKNPLNPMQLDILEQF